MTFSQRKSWADKSSDFNVLLFNLYFISVISINFNLQFNGECLKYKALKMTIGRGQLLTQKYKIHEKHRQNPPR